MTDNRQTDAQDNTPTVPVVLRAWRKGGGVFALFPTLPADEYGRHCTALMHRERQTEARRAYAAMRAG